jgi:hypothetical protein
MAPLKPGIRKRLHTVQNLFLVFPKPMRIFSKRGRNCGSWQKHLLHSGPLLSQIRIFHGLPPLIRMLRALGICRVAALARSNESFFGLKRHQLMALQAMKQRKIINRPRSSHRANRRALSRRSFGRRQLQHSGVLTLAQLRNQGEVPIGKLKRVVMHGRLI